MGGGEELACRMMQSRKCLLERKRCEGRGKGKKKKEVALAAKLLETEGAAGYMCTAGYMRTAGKKRTKKEAALTARSLKTEKLQGSTGVLQCTCTLQGTCVGKAV